MQERLHERGEQRSRTKERKDREGAMKGNDKRRDSKKKMR